MIVLDNGLFGYWRMGEFKLVIQRIKLNRRYLLNAWLFLKKKSRRIRLYSKKKKKKKKKKLK